MRKRREILSNRYRIFFHLYFGILKREEWHSKNNCAKSTDGIIFRWKEPTLPAPAIVEVTHILIVIELGRLLTEIWCLNTCECWKLLNCNMLKSKSRKGTKKSGCTRLVSSESFGFNVCYFLVLLHANYGKVGKSCKKSKSRSLRICTF